MFSSTFPLLRGPIMGILLLFFSRSLFAQDTLFENYGLKPVLVNMSITNIDGKKAVTLRGPTVAQDFQKLVIDYIDRRYGVGGAGQTAAE